MNITLYKKHNFGGTGKLPRFTTDIYNTYWITPIQDASGLFSNWNDYNQISDEELEQLKYDLNYTTLPIPNEEIINARGMFANNKLIRKVEIDFPNVTNIGMMFLSSSIEEIECDFSSVNENNGSAFAQCANLKIIRCDFRNLEKRVMGAGSAYNDTDGLDRYGYGFSFNASPNLTTCECNFASLKNADNLFNKCSNLTTFNCELDSLETAKQMCPNAKLTAESVKNIADKIKTHTDGETHIIDLGLDCTDETFASDFKDHVVKLFNKGWTVTTTPSNIDNIIPFLSKEKTNSCNIVVDGTYNNNLEWTEYRNGMQGKKYGFAMGTDKDSYFNQITIKTHNENSPSPKKIFLQVHDENKNLIGSSSIVEILEDANDYSFDFDAPFLMEKDKTYYVQFFGVDNNNNKINSVRKEVYIRCSVLSEGQYAYGVLHASEINNWGQQWYGEWDGDYVDPHQLNAWCKFNLVEKTSDQTEPITNIEIEKQINTESANATIKSSSTISLSFNPSKELNDVQTINVESQNQLEIIQSTYDTTTNIANISFTSKSETNVGTFFLTILYCNSSNETIYKDYIKYNLM